MDFYKIVWILLPVFFSAVIGYFFGTAKAFREQKLRAYEEILPPIVKAAFDPLKSEESDFNKAVIKLWLFSSRNVALKMDDALSIYVNPERGNLANALQQAIAEMRSDIQFFWLKNWRKKVRPEEVRHFYMFIGRQRNEGSNQQ